MIPHPLRVLNVGCGHMGRSHALAYHHLKEFCLVGLVSRTPSSRNSVNAELGGQYPTFSDFSSALAETRPEAVAISTYPDTHFPYARMALEAGCHVFVEKPLAETVEDAETLINLAKTTNRALVVGYILRVHPSWMRFTELARQLGKPLVMRMNLNQQSSGSNWETHQQLLRSLSPIVDCGVHYVDVMCQMTGSRPVSVSGMGARLTEKLLPGKTNYGQLQVKFADGSVGWYEAGWGPMMSETAFFIKDVIGPKGSVSILARHASAEGASSDVASHTRTESLKVHHAELDETGHFRRTDEWIDLADEPDHDELCRREQEWFLRAINGEQDIHSHWSDCLHSMRIVLGAEESARTGQTIRL